MLNLDDEQFEARLKEFRPLAAEPLPVEQASRARRRKFVLAACAAAIVLAVVAAVTIQQQKKQSRALQPTVNVAATAGGRTLTIRRANELLARAPSVKSALDDLAFQHRARQLPSGTQSALAVLGVEDLKP
jgi:hypothetical protein